MRTKFVFTFTFATSITVTVMFHENDDTRGRHDRPWYRVDLAMTRGQKQSRHVMARRIATRSLALFSGRLDFNSDVSFQQSIATYPLLCCEIATASPIRAVVSHNTKHQQAQGSVASLSMSATPEEDEDEGTTDLFI